MGLLIALGIESFAERVNHHHLADDARSQMRAEIVRNDKTMLGSISMIAVEQDHIRSTLAALHKLQDKGSAAKSAKIGLNIGLSAEILESTAWRTSETTQALTYMPYGEAQTYRDIYDIEDDFLHLQGELFEDTAKLTGLTYRFNAQDGMVTKTAADPIAEQFGLLEAHLGIMKPVALRFKERQDAFLANRDPIWRSPSTFANKAA